MAKKISIHYIFFEPSAALNDAEIVGMTDAQYRAYWQLIFYLYCNYGKCSADYETLASICMKNPNELVFQSKIWPKLRKKFRIKNQIVSHKRVTKELKRAQVKQKQAVKAANARWKKRCGRNADAMPIEAKANRSEFSNSKHSKDNPYSMDSRFRQELRGIDSKLQKLSVSDFASVRLRFIAALENIIQVYTKSDRIAFANLTNWLIKEVVQERFTIQIFGRVLDFAEISKKYGTKPVAYFFGTLRREIGYQRKKS